MANIEIDREAIARIPRELRKERGWSGARSVGIVKLIEERLKVALGLALPVEPEIDPDLLEARKLAADGLSAIPVRIRLFEDRFGVPADEAAQLIETGKADHSRVVERTLAAIKRGRELAAEQAA